MAWAAVACGTTGVVQHPLQECTWDGRREGCLQFVISPQSLLLNRIVGKHKFRHHRAHLHDNQDTPGGVWLACLPCALYTPSGVECLTLRGLILKSMLLRVHVCGACVFAYVCLKLC